ncbi:MAG: DUF4255 domain-containing protein [Roseburia sp.]|nr:DUF4255 domain-containing protein [Roseburia sp.]
MADYTILADVSSFIAKTLRTNMYPEPIPSPNNIEIASPSDTDGDYVLGIYLYDIREEPTVSQPAFVQTDMKHLTKPPVIYGLYYMIFINDFSQLGLKAPDIQKIIGKAAQVINDNNSLLSGELQPWSNAKEPPIILSPANLEFEEKMRVWQSINKPYQLSLFYKASPVFLSSEVVMDASPVLKADFGVQRIDDRMNKNPRKRT